MKRKLVITYSGKFQPFHLGHYLTYLYINSYFNQDNERIYITTANKSNTKECFMDFEQKSKFISKNFGINEKKIVNIKSPYSPVEVLQNYSDDYSFVTILGEKDKERLSTKPYYEEYSEDKELLPHTQKGYYFSTNMKPLMYNGKEINSTLIRNQLYKNINDDVLFDKTSENIMRHSYGKCSNSDSTFEIYVDLLNSMKRSGW